MDNSETLKCLRELLELYPEVEVIETEHCNNNFQLHFRTFSQDSLARIAYAAEASNIIVSVEAPIFQYGYGKPMRSEELHYKISVPEEPANNEKPTTLQELGIYMARDLKALGYLQEEQSNKLQKDWNAFIM